MYQPNYQEGNTKYPSAPTYQPSPATGVPVSSYDQNRPQQEGPWSSGLCDCCSDCKICCLTWWCPCITFGRIAEIVDKGNTSCGTAGALYGLLMWFTGCACIYSCSYRSKLRRQFMLHESPCNDCLVHCCCEACAVCQEYRELQHRGFDPSIGWHENMEKQNRGGVAMGAAPVMDTGMSR